MRAAVTSLVTVVIPTIAPRKEQLRRACNSVFAQTYPETIETSISIDIERLGSAVTRNRALIKVKTEWSAFLDDDDYWMPGHIKTLMQAAEENPKADVIYTGCRVVGRDGREIPRQEEWGRFGQPFSRERLLEGSYIPVTSMVNTDLAKDALFGPPEGVDTPYDDWGFYLRLLKMGATFLHIPIVTWVWIHDGRNTSGQANRW
jgi:hypothetical protein